MQKASMEAPPEEDALAVSLVLRDMGNGVTRLLQLEIMPTAPPTEFFEAFKPTCVPIPLPEKVADLLRCVSPFYGIDPDRRYVGGFMRSLSDDITDLVVW